MLSLMSIDVTLVTVLPSLDAYPQGAPADTCMTMYPKHRGTQSQLDNSVYQVTANLTYSPGRPVTVMIDSPSGAVFKGVQFRARRSEVNQEDIIGEFVNLRPVNKLAFISCQGKTNNMVTHNNTDLVSSVLVDWMPPNQNVGPIVFDVTVVQSFFKIYFGLRSAIVYPAASAGPTVQPSIVAKPISPAVIPVNWDDCGQSKGCLLYPRYCSGDDCKAAVSYQMNSTDNTVTFEMMARTDGYVSLGLSRDRIMGDDQTISCTTLFDSVTIQNGFNHAVKYNVRVPRTNMSNLQAAKIDGTISCRFTRPVSMQMDIVLEEFGQHPPTSFVFDMKENFFLFIAWGKIYTLSDVLGYHTEMPVISEYAVNFGVNKVHRGSVMPALIRAHASLMAVAWLGFAGLAIILARYYKDGFNDRKLCGIKIWFHIHRMSAIMTFLLTISGVILVLIKLDGKITQVSFVIGCILAVVLWW
ncbi:hypothetical protein Btru_075655 [Bulinus truncatus]|nr:hypothetical protein Btru_075655 [Bulinus truncatus]